MKVYTTCGWRYVYNLCLEVFEKARDLYRDRARKRTEGEKADRGKLKVQG